MSLSMPKTCLTDTFMSGRPVTSWVAAAIVPPRPQDNPETLTTDPAGSEYWAKTIRNRVRCDSHSARAKYHNFSWRYVEVRALPLENHQPERGCNSIEVPIIMKQPMPPLDAESRNDQIDSCPNSDPVLTQCAVVARRFHSDFSIAH